MKNSLFLLAFAFLAFVNLAAQEINCDSLPQKRGGSFRLERYDWWVKTDKSPKLMAGKVLFVSDSNLVFSARNANLNYKIPVKNIVYIQKRDPSNIAIGVVLGVLTGGFCGLLIGAVADEDDFLSGAITGSLTGIVAGGIIGGAIGQAKVQIPINGDRCKFKQNFKDKIRLD